MESIEYKYKNFVEYEKLEARVDDWGISIPVVAYVPKGLGGEYRPLMSKEDFIKAYKMYILGETDNENI